jgi:hypothetical protein
MPFVKGQSGNPAGRKAELGQAAELKLLCRAHTVEAVNALVAALADDKTRVAAAVALLDRGWGKPTQEITGADGGPLVEGLTIQFIRPGDAD